MAEIQVQLVSADPDVFEISEDLELCGMNLKCFATPETMKTYQQMYRSEHGRLQKLYADVRASRKDVAVLVNSKECSVEIDASVDKLWIEAEKVKGVDFSIIQKRKCIEKMLTEEAFKHRQEFFEDLNQEENKVYKKMMAQLIDMKIDDGKQATIVETSLDNGRVPEKALYDPGQEREDELISKVQKTTELLRKAAHFMEKSRQVEGLDVKIDEVVAGQLITEGNNLNKVLNKNVEENTGLVPRQSDSEENKGKKT